MSTAASSVTLGSPISQPHDTSLLTTLQKELVMSEPAPFATSTNVAHSRTGSSEAGDGVEKSTTPNSYDGEKKASSEHGSNGEVGSLEKEGGKKKRVPEENDTSGHLHGVKLMLVYISLLLSILLIALDQTILAPALPVIASKFNSLDNIGWIASGFFLSQAPMIVVYGQILRICRVKTAFLSAVTLFELGSLVCAVAPSVNILIFGRAFAGVGAGGIFVCVISIISQIAPLEKRPMLMGGFGGVFGLSSILGPLLGGVFTDHVSWRWCFYINLPIGAITIGSVVFFLKGRPSVAEKDSEDTRPVWKRWLGLDWIGALIMLGLVTCLVLALSWGGNQKKWSDPAVIACFAVFGAFVPIFVAWQWYRKENALLPLRLFKDRSVVGALLSAFFIMLVMLSIIYYLPLQYQAVKHASATKSGIDILPLMLTNVAGAMIGGAIVTYTGEYLPMLIFPPLILCTIGGGLFWTVTADTSSAKLSGYQVLIGVGIGMAMQQTMIAIQAAYNDRESDLPQATAIVTFFQLIGGVIGISIAQSLFQGALLQNLKPLGLSEEIISAVRGSVEVIYSGYLDESIRTEVIKAYVLSLRRVYILCVPSGILAGLSGCLVKHYNLKKMGISPAAGAA